MTQIDELDELRKECNIDEYGTTDENAYYIFKRFGEILATQVQEARIDELNGYCKFLNDKPADSIVSATELMDRYLDRIAQLRSTQ